LLTKKGRLRTQRRKERIYEASCDVKCQMGTRSLFRRSAVFVNGSRHRVFEIIEIITRTYGAFGDGCSPKSDISYQEGTRDGGCGGRRAPPHLTRARASSEGTCFGHDAINHLYPSSAQQDYFALPRK
jgi:hypothetical protein